MAKVLYEKDGRIGRITASEKVDHLYLTWSYFVNVLVPQVWKGDGVYMH